MTINTNSQVYINHMFQLYLSHHMIVPELLLLRKDEGPLRASEKEPLTGACVQDPSNYCIWGIKSSPYAVAPTSPLPPKTLLIQSHSP
mmetsp:Transcript_84623/g.148408  ORF Transcript_84623/g.148408 Transcript_84623/m.148408 type:complete len:88 (-) Transcript_84623:1171-1434(-)